MRRNLSETKAGTAFQTKYKRFKSTEIAMDMTRDRLQGVGEEAAGEGREVSKTLADSTRVWTLSCRTYRIDRKQAAGPDFCPRKIILEDV